MAALVVISFPEAKVVGSKFARVTLTQPYLAGFLAFREVGPLQDLYNAVMEDEDIPNPQIVLVDGNGTLHPAGFGLACHLGVVLDLPTIGIGKNLHMVDGLSRQGIKDLALTQGNAHYLTGVSGTLHGAALQSGPGSNPIFISPGHKISHQSALALTRALCIHRIPEPVRQADLRSREWIRNHAK